ncbi:MAG TPA: hypothetical protein VKM55_02715 [Candidatus Lokiarchaeia archaeon]|nr:hypothetical protein [Candidatus Lokiarchaeia archaeon]
MIYDIGISFSFGRYIVRVLLVVVTLVLVCTNYFWQAKKITELPSQRWLFFGFGFFMTFLAISKIIIIVEFNFASALLHAFFDPLGSTANLISQISFVPALWAFEKYIIPQTRHIFTILAFCMVAISTIPLILNTNNKTILIGEDIGAAPLFAVVAIMFLILIKRTTGKVRKRSAQMFIGLVTMVLGMLLDNNSVIAMQIIPLWVTPAIYFVSVLIFGLTTRRT